MKHKAILIFTNITILVGIVALLYVLFGLKINSLTGWIVFGGWLSAPYAISVMGLFMLYGEKEGLLFHCWGVIIAVAIGLYLIVDITYIHPDAQGALALLMVPLFQVGAYLAGYGIAYFIDKKST